LEFFEPGVWVSVYPLDVAIWTRLFRIRCPIVCGFALAAIFDCDGIKDVFLFTTLGCSS
jgi:hypothetical protein